MEIYRGLTFDLTEEHIKLLRQAYVRWEHCEFGAPAIDPKRPYGNSSVEIDIAEILGWSLFIDDDDEGHMSREQVERACQLHLETLTALQVILATGSMEPGTYRRSEEWKTDWKAAV
jgi:hypothetical protein